MARRDLLEDLDGLDERFYMGYEDTDLSRRIRDRGLRLEILVEAEIVHYFGHSKRKRGARDAHLYRWDRGPLLYLRKHHHPVWSLLLRMLKLPERFSRARPSLDREAPSDSSARELGWHGSEPPYLVELSNSPRFLDSFLAATDDSRMTIPAALTARLAPGTYHWRTRPLARPWDGTHLGCGSFVRR